MGEHFLRMFALQFTTQHYVFTVCHYRIRLKTVFILTLSISCHDQHPHSNKTCHELCLFFKTNTSTIVNLIEIDCSVVFVISS